MVSARRDIDSDIVCDSFITFLDCLKLDFGAVFFYDVNAKKPK